LAARIVALRLLAQEGAESFATSYENLATRLANRAAPMPTAASPAVASARRFVVTQARQALQQTAVVGVTSPSFDAACIARPCQICFTIPGYLRV
jgi:hypothetical protein